MKSKRQHFLYMYIGTRQLLRPVVAVPTEMRASVIVVSQNA